MADSPDLRAVGERLEELLEGLRHTADAGVWTQVEEVVRLVTDLYGAGLARILVLVEQATGPADLVARMAGDEIVGSLLVVHDLQPDVTAPAAAPARAPAPDPALLAPSVTPGRLTQKGAPAGAQP